MSTKTCLGAYGGEDWPCTSGRCIYNTTIEVFLCLAHTIAMSWSNYTTIATVTAATTAETPTPIFFWRIWGFLPFILLACVLLYLFQLFILRPFTSSKTDREKLSQALEKAQDEGRTTDVEVLQRVADELWPEWFDRCRGTKVCTLLVLIPGCLTAWFFLWDILAAFFPFIKELVYRVASRLVREYVLPYLSWKVALLALPVLHFVLMLGAACVTFVALVAILGIVAVVVSALAVPVAIAVAFGTLTVYSAKTVDWSMKWLRRFWDNAKAAVTEFRDGLGRLIDRNFGGDTMRSRKMTGDEIVKFLKDKEKPIKSATDALTTIQKKIKDLTTTSNSSAPESLSAVEIEWARRHLALLNEAEFAWEKVEFNHYRLFREGSATISPRLINRLRTEIQLTRASLRPLVNQGQPHRAKGKERAAPDSIVETGFYCSNTRPSVTPSPFPAALANESSGVSNPNLRREAFATEEELSRHAQDVHMRRLLGIPLHTSNMLAVDDVGENSRLLAPEEPESPEYTFSDLANSSSPLASPKSPPSSHKTFFHVADFASPNFPSTSYNPPAASPRYRSTYGQDVHTFPQDTISSRRPVLPSEYRPR